MLTKSHRSGQPWTNVLARLEDERLMLLRVAAGEPLTEVLDHVLELVEAQSSVALRTSILLVDDDGNLRAGAAPNLPADYLQSIVEQAGAAHGCWSKAVESGEPVYVEDITADPDWLPWRDRTLALGLQSCWCAPIKTIDGRVLGVLSNYYGERRKPTAHDIEAIALVTRTAALAMERHRIETTLRQSATRWRELFEGMQEGFILAAALRDAQGRIEDFRLLEVNPAFEQQCGQSRGSAEGRRLREVLGHTPEALLLAFAEVIDSGTATQFDYCVPGNPPFWYELRARPAGPGRLTVMLLDVSARKAAEAELWEEQRHKSFLLTLGDRLRTLAEPGQIENSACESLGIHLQLAHVGLLQRNADHAALNWHVFWSANAATPRPDPALLVDAVTRALGEERGIWLRGDGMQAQLLLPLARWGRPDYALLVQPQHSLHPGEQGCVEEVAERLCDALERALHARLLEQRVENAIAERDRIWRLSPEVLAIMDGRGQFISANPAVRAILGWTSEQFLTLGFTTLVHPEDRLTTSSLLAQALGAEGGGPHLLENRLRRRDGGYCWITWTISRAEGHLYLAGRDDSHSKAQAETLRDTENTLRQAQKMEAVGRLTGGIAHDFNNMLQGISGALYLIQRKLNQDDEAGARRFIGVATDAAGRAAHLTQRLLTFSRRQPINPRACDAGDMLRSMADLFRRYTGEHVTLDFDIGPQGWACKCDANQFESAVLNLVINACDAMADGGKLTLRTRNAVIGQAELRRLPEMTPGDYVEVAVIDQGSGMSAETLAHAFDPFYSTKPLGSGTGLGLSMVYGFAQQAGGAASISSAPGEGTTVSLYLPRHQGRGHADIEALGMPTTFLDRRQPAQILLVEDDEHVRTLVREALDGLHAQVRSAADGHAGALALDHSEHLDILITDLGLPGLSGRHLAAHARRRWPGLPILFMTGYAEDASRDSGLIGPGMELIIKPFDLDALTERVQHMLTRALPFENACKCNK